MEESGREINKKSFRKDVLDETENHKCLLGLIILCKLFVLYGVVIVRVYDEISR